jgi:hypothetical protein
VTKILRDSGATTCDPDDLIVYINERSVIRFTTQHDVPIMIKNIGDDKYKKSKNIVVLALIPAFNEKSMETISTGGKTIKIIYFYYQISPNGPITTGNQENYNTSCKDLRSIISEACRAKPSNVATINTLHIEYPKQPVGVMEIPILGVAAVVLAVASSVFAT